MQSEEQNISAVKAFSFQKTIGVFAIQILCRPYSIGINLLGLLPSEQKYFGLDKLNWRFSFLLGSFKRKNEKHVKLTGFKTVYYIF